MKQRVITGVILAAILLPFLFVPKWLFFVLIAVLVGVGIVEMFTVLTKQQTIPKAVMLYPLMGAIILYGGLLLAYLGVIHISLVAVLLLVAVITGLMLTVFVPAFSSSTLALGWFAIIYVSIGFLSVSAIRHDGITTLIYLLLLVMMTDNFAYIFGMKIGKRKLAPTISPKKSVEGAIAGTLVGVPIATWFAYAFDVYPFDAYQVFLVVAIPVGIVISALGQIGDLIASRIKRDANVKDFSNLLPGHGGILDRFDSTAFASMALFAVLMIIERL